MKINNVSRRLIAGAMGAIALISCTSCGSKENNTNSIEQRIGDSFINHEDLIKCYLVEINIGISQKLFICKRNLVDENKKAISKVDDNSVFQYVDLLSNEEIYNQKVLSGEKFDTLDVVDLIRANDNIEDYLVNFNLVKDNYTKGDIELLMSSIYSVYKYSGDNDIKYKIKTKNEDKK